MKQQKLWFAWNQIDYHAIYCNSVWKTFHQKVSYSSSFQLSTISFEFHNAKNWC